MTGWVWWIWEVEGQPSHQLLTVASRIGPPFYPSFFPCVFFSFTPSMPRADNMGLTPMTSALPPSPQSLPSLAGYQGSFHAIQNCFPYGDCYRTTEPAASRDGLVGDAHGFNPLRPNTYSSLSAPLPVPGKLPQTSLPRALPRLALVGLVYCLLSI